MIEKKFAKIGAGVIGGVTVFFTLWDEVYGRLDGDISSEGAMLITIMAAILLVILIISLYNYSKILELERVDQ